QELPKLPTSHRKGNDIVNSALIKIDPNKASDKSNMEINPMQENKIIVSAKQTLANQSTLSRIRKEKIKRSLILWDIPNETHACQIRKNLSFYGRLTVKSFKANGKSKAAFVEIEFKNKKLTGSNAIKIINKRNFSSLEDNRDINLQKVISGRTRRESLKEQDRETTRELVKSTITLLTGTLVVYESVDEPVGSSSKVPSMDTNRKGLLQKELTLKIGCHNINRLKTNQQKFKTLGQWLDNEVFDIFAVTETNLNRKEGFFVGKKKKYLEGVDRISEFIIAARFYFRNMELIIIAIYIPPNNGSEMDKLNKNDFIDIFKFLNLTKKEITWSNDQSSTRIDQSENLIESLTRAEILDMYFVTCSDHKATSTTLWFNPQIFGSTVAVEKNRKHHRIVYLYDQATIVNWEDFRSVLDKKLQKEKTILDKLS
ncbi:8217_t:CDS:2, partial [Gigaspora margarita]